MSLAVLITSIVLDWPSGTVVYTRDLALELLRQGHRPTVYTWVNGRVGRELASAGIRVVDDLWRLRDRPDVIHANHSTHLRGALLRFPEVPAISICHNHTDPWDALYEDPRVRRYFGVSHLCVARRRAEGSPADRTAVLPNFVDLGRLPVRPPLPASPRRALVFSNYATADSQLPAIEEACRRQGLELDVIGRGVGRLAERPEEIIGGYDIVFAKAKAAMEAMAVGTAVVLCDFGGVGPMVRSADLDRLRPLNFGFEALVDSLTSENVEREILRYDAADAAVVRTIIRDRCGLDAATRDLVSIYEEVIAEASATGAEERPAIRAQRRRVAELRYRGTSLPLSLYYRAFGMGPHRIPAPIKPLYRAARFLVRRLLWAR